MPKHGPETTVEIRAAVISLRMFTDKPYTIIGQNLGINPNTCKSIWQRAKTRNNGQEDLGMFRHLADAPRPGRRLTPPPNAPVREVRKPLPQDMIFELRDGQWVQVTRTGSPVPAPQPPNPAAPPVAEAQHSEPATPVVETQQSNHASPVADVQHSRNVSPVVNTHHSRTATPVVNPSRSTTPAPVIDDTQRSGSVSSVVHTPQETNRSPEKSPAPEPEVGVSGPS